MDRYLSTSCCLVTFVTAVIYRIMIFEASVFPEPLSPAKCFKNIIKNNS